MSVKSTKDHKSACELLILQFRYTVDAFLHVDLVFTFYYTESNTHVIVCEEMQHDGYKNRRDAWPICILLARYPSNYRLGQYNTHNIHLIGTILYTSTRQRLCIAQSCKVLNKCTPAHPVYSNFSAFGNLAGVILFLCRNMQLLSCGLGYYWNA